MADPMKPPKAFKEQQLNKSKGILDDYAVRKSMASREGSITKTPTADIDIANKEYVDTLTPDHPHQDVQRTASPNFEAVDTVRVKTNDGNLVIVSEDDDLSLQAFGSIFFRIDEGTLALTIDSAGDFDFEQGNLTTTGDFTGTTLNIDHIAENTAAHRIVFDNAIQAGAIYSNFGLVHTGDPDTYISFTVNDRFFFTCGGIQMMDFTESFINTVTVNPTGADVDFRVEGTTDGNLIFANAGTNRVGIGTSGATTKFSVMEKSGMTPIGGFAIKLTNKTGSNTVAGQLVAVYTTTAVDDAFVTCSASDDNVIGIVLDAGVADASEAWVVVGGIADVLMDGGGSARGDRIISSATAGSADVWNTGGAVATHFLEIGHCIETRTGAGLARCVLHFL